MSQDVLNKRIVVHGAIKQLGLGETIPYLAYSLIEYAGLNDSEATINAAAVSRNGRGLLMLGKSGSGKTTLALELCIGAGCLLVANDLTVLKNSEGCVSLTGGTKHFYARLQNLEKFRPELVASDTADKDGWWTRRSILPSDIGVSVEGSSIPLQQAVFINLSATDNKLMISPIDGRWLRLFLYEQLSRYILRSRLPILLGKDELCLYAPSLDSEELHARRVELMEKLISTTNLHHVSGGVDELKEYVLSLLH